MAEELAVVTERVDDIPLLLAQEERLGIARLIEEHFPPHGNWRGLSPGQTLAVWLAHILSEADHRLNHVQPWAAKLLSTLGMCLGQPVSEMDFTDDRLALLLTALSDDRRWNQFESALNGQVLRVYDLRAERVRVDSTTTTGYWHITDGGLFQIGHSKDHRAGRQPQLKVVLSVLDPLGLPVVTQVVAGHRSDDPLYIPAIQQVRDSLCRSGLLYVGDCKLPARETRAFVQAGGDFYLAPLSKVQLPDDSLQAYLAPVWRGEQALQPVTRVQLDGELHVIAEGFECEEPMDIALDEQRVCWTERRLVIRSLGQAKAQQVALQRRLTAAQTKLEALNVHKQGRKIYIDLSPLQDKVQTILDSHRVAGLLTVRYEQRPTITSPKGKPKPVIWVQAVPNEMAIQQAEAYMGWKVYATNQSQDSLSLEQAVLAYREQYTVERSLGRLKGKPLSLSPMYLQDEGRATGLVRLLSLGVRLLTLLEFSVQRRLTQEQSTLAGVYAGNPTRATARPSAQLLLEAFQHVTLTVLTVGQQVHSHLTPLSDVQHRILTLLDVPIATYTRLSADPPIPP
jgi:transposase